MPDTVHARWHARLPRWPADLVTGWWVVLGGAVLGLAVGAVTVSRIPQQFTAEALVAPTRAWTQVQFEPSIQSVDDNTRRQNGASITPERRQALVDLVGSSAVEQRAAEYALQSTGASGFSAGSLALHVRGELKPRSELIAIRASANTPDEAVRIADVWARAYVDVVNTIYAPADKGSSLDQLRANAQQDLQAAQDALTASIADGRLESLTWKIGDDEQILTLLRAPYEVPSQTSLSSTPTPKRLGEPGSTFGNTAANPSSSGSTTNGDQPEALTSRVDRTAATSNGTSNSTQTRQQAAAVGSISAANDYRLAERRTVDDIAQILRRLDATRESVRALMNEVNSGSPRAASSPAIALIKSQLVTISSGLPAQLQLQVPGAASIDSQADLESLAATIDQARARVATELESRRQAYEQHRDQQIAGIEDELRILRAQREEADAQRRALTARRDLASETYQALSRKTEEERVAGGTQGREVELASTANAASLAGTPPLVVMGTGLALGLLLASGLVFGANFARFARRATPPLPLVARPVPERARRERHTRRSAAS